MQPMASAPARGDPDEVQLRFSQLGHSRCRERDIPGRIQHKQKMLNLIRPATHQSTGSSIEPLESRIAPAASVLSIGGTTTASFVDADGDTITLHISGTAGTLTLADTTSDATVSDGESIG